MKSILVASIIAAAGAATALSWIPVTVSAADIVGVVKQRRDAMKANSAALKTIKEYTEGKADKAAAEKSADRLVTIAKALPQYFPKGTSSADMPGKTNAKPVIWTDMGKFEAAQKQLVSATEKLDEAVKAGDPKAVAAQIGNVGKNGCLNCHATFRGKLS